MAQGVLKEESGTNEENAIVVRKIQDVIKEKYAEKITIGYIADAINYSQKHTQRIFVRMTGKTIYEYLTSVRMEKAKELLAEKDSKIYVVSNNVGYKNNARFSKVFKEYTGYTPSEYKRK